jgi:predicted enzyme related to lactoylglutathione lyase
MARKARPNPGTIAWADLTVPQATKVRNFYAAVTGWKPAPVSMGSYNDYNMTDPETGKPAAGICHARGSNADLPPQWLIYIVVVDLNASLTECEARGGVVVAGPKSMGGQARYAVIRDPAGAMAALYEPA